VRHFVAAKILCLHWFDAEWLTAQASSFKQQATSNKQQATSERSEQERSHKLRHFVAVTICNATMLTSDFKIKIVYQNKKQLQENNL